jgi:hypothetical protein
MLEVTETQGREIVTNMHKLSEMEERTVLVSVLYRDFVTVTGLCDGDVTL